MGGAERAERRRKQARSAGSTGSAGPRSAGTARSASAGGGDRGRVIGTVVVVLVLAAAVLGGVLWQRSRSAPPEAEPTRVTAEYPVRLDGGTVVAGEDTAKTTIDVYEDFLCPACGTFEERDAGKIERALAAGTIKVRYHMVNLLDEKSNPPGYSLHAASAGLCAADAGGFPSFHASLFASQPREGGRGYSDDQLVQLGRDVGITSDAFESCVRNGKYHDAVRAEFATASADTALRRPGPGGNLYFGTPTVTIDGKVADLANSAWLDDAIRSAG